MLRCSGGAAAQRSKHGSPLSGVIADLQERLYRKRPAGTAADWRRPKRGVDASRRFRVAAAENVDDAASHRQFNQRTVGLHGRQPPLEPILPCRSVLVRDHSQSREHERMARNALDRSLERVGSVRPPRLPKPKRADSAPRIGAGLARIDVTGSLELKLPDELFLCRVCLTTRKTDQAEK